MEKKNQFILCVFHLCFVCLCIYIYFLIGNLWVCHISRHKRMQSRDCTAMCRLVCCERPTSHTPFPSLLELHLFLFHLRFVLSVCFFLSEDFCNSWLIFGASSLFYYLIHNNVHILTFFMCVRNSTYIPNMIS